MAIDEVKADDLIRRAVRGEGSAFGRLVGTYHERIKAVIKNRMPPYLKKRVDLSDVAQEAQIVAWKRLREYDPEKGSFYPWLAAIARDRLAAVKKWHAAKKRDARRDESPGAAFSDASAEVLVDRLIDKGPSPSSCAGREERRDLVRGAIEQLEDDHRQILELHYVEGLRFEAIAGRLGIKPGTVRMRHLRALEHFETTWKECPARGS